MAYPYCGIHLSDKKDLAIDICNTWLISGELCFMKKDSKRLYTVWFYFYNTVEFTEFKNGE